MDSILNLEIQITLLIQAIGSWLVIPMKVFDFLGKSEFYMVAIPAIYWLVDTGLGLRMALILMASASLNHSLKLLFHSPRPYWTSASVTQYAQETSFGLPSGHAQVAASVWGYPAVQWKQRWVRWASALIIFLYGFSRLYLGVHFLRDVLLGWALGLLTLLAFTVWQKPVSKWFTSQKMPAQIGAAFLSALAFIGLSALFRAWLGDWQPPAAWAAYMQADPTSTASPLSMENVITTAGAWFGLIAGYSWQLSSATVRLYANLPPKITTRLLRWLVGTVGILLIYLILSKLFPSGENITGYILRFVRYTLIGLWITGLSPWVFKWLRLSAL
jgi:membrane-associated phospholipid phosphatase